jgi:hypothetical protein
MMTLLASAVLTLAFTGSAAAAPPTQAPRVVHLTSSTTSEHVTYTSRTQRSTCPKGQHLVPAGGKQHAAAPEVCKR